LKSPNSKSAVVAKKSQLDEIVRCGKDPEYFTNRYVKITHPERGLVPFKTYEFQDDCLREFNKHRFNIVLKSRQLGLSTITAAYSLWKAIFYRQKSVLVIATKLSTAQNFIRKVKVMLENLPPWLVISEVTSQTKTQIEFANGSIVKAVPTSEDAGRSEALSLLIVDEAAFIRDFDELWKGLYPTLSTGGNAIILSTPAGVGNQFHKLWIDAEAGVSNFNAIKLPWHVHPEHDEKWFEHESRNMTRKQIAQELLCDFSSSGDTFISIEDYEKIRAGCRNPIERWGPEMCVWVWKYAIPNHKYVISADVSRGDANDYSTIQVFDTTECEQVCEFKGKLPPDQLGILINEIGLRYNKGQVCPENNTYGFATITKLKELAYPNLYINDVRFRYAADIPIGKIGFNTNGQNKPTILTKLEEYLRTGKVKINSARLLDELKTFVWIGNSARAQKGFNDDLVMAAAIACNLFEPSRDTTNNTQSAQWSLLSGFKVNASQNSRPLPIQFGAADAMKPHHYDSRYFGGNSQAVIPPELLWMYK
jgi:hypothetical protein